MTPVASAFVQLDDASIDLALSAHFPQGALSSAPRSEREFNNHTQREVWQGARDIEVDKWKALNVYTEMPVRAAREKYGDKLKILHSLFHETVKKSAEPPFDESPPAHAERCGQRRGSRE